MKKKICSKCGEGKSIDDFGNKKASRDGKRSCCRECHNEANRAWRAVSEVRKTDAYREKARQYSRIRYMENPEKARLYSIEYYYKNKAVCNKKRQERMRENPDSQLKSVLRCRVRNALRGELKAATTFELLGCSLEEFKKHIEHLFDEKMTWENRGQWHIDHVVPCAMFDLSDPEQQRKCFHYTNLQPLWAEDNLKKGSTPPLLLTREG